MEIKFDPDKHHKSMTLEQVIQIRLREIDEEREQREKAAQQTNDGQLELPLDAKPT